MKQSRQAPGCLAPEPLTLQPECAGVVSAVQCTSYEFQVVAEAVEQLLVPLGGLAHFVQRGNHVHLKPNLLAAKEPARAITTHPVVVEAVVRMLLDLGAKVTIGDSPAGAVKGLQRYWDNTGLSEVAKRTGARLVAFETGGVQERVVRGRSYYISRYVIDADVVINLPKLKTHGLTLYTGAVKNLFGVIPGLRKSEYHKQAPHPEDFAEVLVDIYSAVRPHLHIADGVVGQEGNGPSSGRVRPIGVMLASTDGVALDAVGAAIMGFDPEEIDTTRIASQRGLGEGRLEHIKVVGADLESLRLPDFVLPSNRLIKLVPRWLMILGARLIWVRPRADRELCKRCGVCQTNCPVGAISTDADGYPVMDYTRCIKCMCCDEGCPHQAIEQEMSWLARRFS
ncbi:MAG: DUF362 domain-containing protein [candidate division KSB1 bacterium]|nr:DUF362 domain-containing protein [candidate division KSB1 bacterium]